MGIKWSIRMGKILVIWLVAGSPLSASNYSCEDVRAYVQANGKALAWVKAAEMIAAGQLTWGQLRAARACLAAGKGKSGG